MRKKHISTEIFTYVSMGFLFIIILLCGVFLMYQKKIVQEKVNASISGILNQTSNTLIEKLDRTEALARTLRFNTTLLEVLQRTPDFEDAKAVDKVISDMGNSKIWGEEYITILGRNGHIFVNWSNDGGNQYNQRIKKLKARIYDENDILAVMPYEMFADYDNPDQFDRNKKLIGVTSFIYDHAYTSNRVGIMTVSIPEQSMVNVMEGNKLFDESEVYMIDKAGTILLSTNHRRVGEILNIESATLENGPVTSGYCELFQDGKKKMAFYQYLNSDWIQMVIIPYTAYAREVRLMILTFLLVAVLAILLALLISFLISYSISKPIKQLEQSIDQITNGDFKNRVQVVRTDDIGKLGIHFNAMADNLGSLIEEKIENQKQTSALVIANQTAELKMLHAQINPHFLFNTLNSIRCLALINKVDYIAHMLESLGAILENNIMKGSENTSIENEINLQKKYIELQQMRYGKRLKAEFAVDEEIFKNEIPKFMLQPLVENAIIHGIGNKLEGGTVTIRGRRQGDFIILEVEDDGIGLDENKLRISEEMDNDEEPKTNHGIALPNIRKRLTLIYGSHCSFTIKAGQGGKGTIAVLTFPVRKSREVPHA